MSTKIFVKSIADLNYAAADIWKLHPVICVGDECFEIVHPKMTDAIKITFCEENETKSITYNCRLIGKLNAQTHTVDR